MASRVKDQAFPFLKPHEDVGTYIPGMTLRDYFAAKAMQALLPLYEQSPDFDLCDQSYSLADRMLEARK